MQIVWCYLSVSRSTSSTTFRTSSWLPQAEAYVQVAARQGEKRNERKMKKKWKKLWGDEWRANKKLHHNYLQLHQCWLGLTQSLSIQHVSCFEFFLKYWPDNYRFMGAGLSKAKLRGANIPTSFWSYPFFQACSGFTLQKKVAKLCVLKYVSVLHFPPGF